MSTKTHVTTKNVQEIIKAAVDKLVDVVKPTYGPASNKVLISKITHGLVVDDGVQIARDIELEDPAEHAIMKVVRETAIRTNDRVGDGTTGALIMLQAIIEAFWRRPFRNGRAAEKELAAALDECRNQVRAAAKPVKTRDELRRVARVSFDDEKVANMIADAWHKLGPDGALTVDRSGTMETYVDLADGLTFQRGYISPYMVTDPRRMEAVIEKPHILFTDYRLTEVNDVIGIMNKLAGAGVLSLVIVAENVEANALATMVVNKMQGKFNAVAVVAPQAADRTVALEDMALMCGGRVFSEKKGDKLEKAEVSDLGRADRFIARRTESVIVGPRGKKTDVAKAIAHLHAAASKERNEAERKHLEERAATFSGKVGVVRVGAPTENETNALRYKVEDAVNAVRAAFKGGVVAGGGATLASLETSSPLMRAALSAPMERLLANSGASLPHPLKPGEAMNVVTGKAGPWEKVGVCDPADVVVAQLESAVSIASVLATTSALIVEEPEHLTQERG